jgi:branched-chain amino acid transport system substrate-binding protein
MSRWLAAVVFAALALCAAVPGFAAEKRVALVVGNSAYATVPRLANAQNDARAIAQILKALDFQTVEIALNQPNNRLRDTVQRFQRLVATADVALVFYAGHGVEVGGRNYLVPIDAQLKSDMDVAFEAIPLDLVMQAVEPAKNLRIIVLDACRDNPFLNRMVITQGGSRSAGRGGLARVDPTGDTLVAYAAKAGSTALDGTGPNSPFTTALLKHLPTPGLDIRLMFGRVRDTVLELTSRQQEPFVYGSIGGREVYLKPGAAPPSSVTSAPPAPSLQAQTEIAFWESVRNATAAAPLQSYLDRYPSGAFAGLARARIQELGKEPAPSQQLALTRSAPATVSPNDRFFRATSREPLRIAVVGPMSGADAARGAQLRNGAEQALADINGGGGILGRQVALTVADDFSSPRMVTSVASKLAADGVQFVIGHVNADMTMAASALLQEKGIVQLAPAIRNPDYTERGLWNVFRTSGRDDAQGAVAAAHIAARFKGKRLALVHDRTAYGKGLVDEVRRGITGAAIREVLHEGVNVGERDFSALIAAIKGANPDLVYWGGQHTEGALLVRQMRERGVKIPFIAGDAITADEFAAVGGPSIEGTMITQERDLQNSPDARVVAHKLRARRIEPDVVTLNTYAAVQVIKQAAEAARSSEPRAVADKMRSGHKFRTVIGEIAFDQKGDMTRPSYALHIWKKDASGRLTSTEVK